MRDVCSVCTCGRSGVSRTCVTKYKCSGRCIVEHVGLGCVTSMQLIARSRMAMCPAVALSKPLCSLRCSGRCDVVKELCCLPPLLTGFV